MAEPERKGVFYYDRQKDLEVKERLARERASRPPDPAPDPVPADDPRWRLKKYDPISGNYARGPTGPIYWTPGAHGIFK